MAHLYMNQVIVFVMLKKKGASTAASRELAHLTNTAAVAGFTSGFRWDRVEPCSYGRLTNF